MMLQKKLASEIMECGPSRIKIRPEDLNEVKEAITKFDVRNLINKGLIKVEPARGTSKVRIREAKKQKRKGRRRGYGSRKGTFKARIDKKTDWINKVRLQRSLLSKLKEKKLIEPDIYWNLYKKSKGGYFRSIRHIKIYLKEHNLVKK